MKFVHFAFVALLATASAASAADAAKPEPRPSGVSEAQWVALSETFGFIVTKDVRLTTIVDPVTGEKKKIQTMRDPRVSGYFVVRREGVWCRVNVDPGDAFAAPLSSR